MLLHGPEWWQESLVETRVCNVSQEIIYLRMAREKLKKYTITGQEEELVTYDFLYCNDKTVFMVHKRVLEKLLQMCPDDFEVTPVIIENLKSEPQAFINRDFVSIDVLHKVRAIDKGKTRIRLNDNDFGSIIIYQYKEDCMDGHLLALDNISLDLLFDPKLAREFANSKGSEFVDSSFDLYT
ncbi:MAG: hypothetical protein EOP33_01215 [Rickettsiaceae bacterium]|nr:MAG: hypothetical protein EOP33_01215 [Rickettsiaceae bacterium]